VKQVLLLLLGLAGYKPLKLDTLLKG